MVDKFQKNKINHLWIGDIEASCHMTNSLSGYPNIKDEGFSITVGDGKASMQ